MSKLIHASILSLLLAILCGVVFHAPLSVGFGVLFPGFELGIKAWKEILLVIVGILIVAEVTRRGWWRRLWSDWVIRVAVAYSVLCFILLPFMWHGIDPAVAALMIDLRFIAFFIATYVSCRLYPSWRWPLVVGSIVVAAASILFAVLQVTILPHDFLVHIGYGKDTIAPYMTVDQNYNYIRINGTLRGPNPLGIYATFIGIASLVVLLTKRAYLRRVYKYLPWGVGALAVGSAVALWFSYSRSALLAAISALVVVFIAIYGQKISKKIWMALGISTLLLVGGIYATRDVPFVSQVILHEDPHEGGNINSNDGHWESLVDGMSRMARQPFGAGVGSTGSPSLMTDEGLIMENYYLYVAHEAGWLGLVLFVALSVLVLHRLWLRRSDWLAMSLFATGIGCIVASVFLPVWADDTVSLVWWGLAGVALAHPVKRKNKEVHRG